MILSDRDIKKALRKKEIILTPRPNLTHQLGSCSLDLRLGAEFRIYQYSTMPFIDIKKEIPTELTKKVILKKPQNYFVLQPGEFVLASTLEWIELSDTIAARLEGRSSLGRLGVMIHATASLIPPGWKGNIVLELGNIARMPVTLYPRMRICALSFEYLTSPVEIPYTKRKNAKYIHQKGTEGTKIHTEKI